MTRRAISLSVFALLTTMPASVRAAAEAPDLRYSAVFKETLDGSTRPVSAAETELVRALIDAGIVFVDETQSRKIRSVTDADQVLANGAAISDVVTTLDADVLIVGVTELVRVPSKLLADSVHRFHASIKARAIAVDDARTIASIETSGEGIGYSPEQAGDAAAKAAAAPLVKDMLARVNAMKGTRVELTVSGIPNASVAEVLLQSLSRASAVRRARMLHAGRDVSKIELETDGGPTRQLAVALDSLNIGLTVTGYSERALRAELDTTRSTKLSLAKQAERRREGARQAIEIVKLELVDVFPALIAANKEGAIGTVTLRNNGRERVEDVVVLASLRDFSGVALTVSAGTIEKGAELTVPVRVVLDPARLEQHAEDRTAALSVDVEYNDGAFRARMTRSAAVVVHNKNVLSWDEPESAAAFVTAKAEPVVMLARELRAQIPAAKMKDPLALPVALFRGIAAMGLVYTPDPSSPFGKEKLDYVQYPVETLEKASGDCDDLTVLYASLAEAVGSPVLLITTPGHLFLAVSTGLPPQSAHKLALDPSLLVAHRGQLWVPFETTKLSGTFEEAWHAAAAELTKWRGKKGMVGLVDVRDAWTRYPAGDLATSSAEALRKRSFGTLRREIDADLRALELARLQEIDAALAELDRAKSDDDRSLGQKAVLFAQAGRFAEAKTLLEGLVARARTDFVSLNNLGNLHMVTGSPLSAHALYQAALARAPEDQEIAVRINTALSSLVLGKESEFADHIVVCLDKGGEEAVMSLSRAGIGAHARGASSSAEVPPVAEYLHWLSPARQAAGR